MDRIYLEDELVSFGNYVLSKERSLNTSAENQNMVSHADLENWKTLNPEIEYPEIPEKFKTTDFIKEILGESKSGSTLPKPPLGLMPKRLHDRKVKVERFNDVCAFISKYYNLGIIINPEWIDEYNELVTIITKDY